MAGTDSTYYPLTSPQAAIWLDMARGHDPSRYNICNVFDFEGALDVGKLRQAIVQTDRENDALTLRFAVRNGELQQHFTPTNRPIEFEVIDLQFEDDPERIARQKVAQFRERVFDLENGENCRHQVLRLGENRYWWARVYHHIVCDGYGGHLMAERNAAIYNALKNDETIPDCSFKSYRAFIETDNAYPQTTAYARDVAYWRERLTPDRSPTGVTTLPINGPQKDAQVVIPVSTETLDALNATARNAGTTPTAILMGLFAVFLGKVTGEREPMWNLPILNRLGREERETPGAFSCIIPYSVKLDEQKSILELSDQIFKQSRRDIRHVRMSPVRMRDAGLGLRSLTATGATFNSLDAATAIHFDDLSVRRINIYHGPADDIGLAFFSETISPSEQKSELIWQYDANRIDAQTTQALTTAFSRLLDIVLADPDQNIGALLDQIDIDPVHIEALRPRGTGENLAQQLATYVKDVWAGILEIDDLEIDENLIVAGAHSLLLPQAQSIFAELADRVVKLEEMHEYPTAQSFANNLIKTSPRLDETRLKAAIDRLGAHSTKTKTAKNPAVPLQWQDGTIILPFAAKSRDELDENLATALRRLEKGAAPENLVDPGQATTPPSESCERSVIVGTSTDSIIKSLGDPDDHGHLKGRVDAPQNSIVLLFPGQGSQRPGMARALYDADPVSAQLIDAACKSVVRHSGPADLRDLLLYADQSTANIEKLARTDYAQPALFITEYAKASWLMRLGIKPTALLGHSIGEYVAACLAGVMQFEDALRLVVMRGKLMSQTEPGAMFALSMTEDEVDEILTRFGPDLSLAAQNGPRQFVVAGNLSVIDAVEAHINEIGKEGRRLIVSRAFHSKMMEPVLDRFRNALDQIELHAPTIEIQSNLTGTVLRPKEATNPDYWVSHLRNAVRFADNINHLKTSHPDALYVECGFGNTASRLATVNGIASTQCIALQADLNAGGTDADQQASLNPLAIGLAKLWLHGIGIEFGDGTTAPTYPWTQVEDERGAVITSFQPHPAVAGQWLARRDLPPDDSYHIVVSFRLPVGTSFDVLKAAFEKVVASCDSFRSTFVEQNGELVQRVHESMPVPVNIVERLEDIRHGLFDLENGPLLRVGYVAQTNVSSPIVVIAIDHICFDGQSLPLLEKAVIAALGNDGAELPRQNSREIAKLSIKALEGQRGQIGATFWKERSEFLLGPSLPKTAEPGATKQVKRCFVQLDATQVNALETVRTHLGTATPTALWNALVLATVAHYKTGNAAVIGQPFSGRVGPETREAIGCFANVLPIAIKPDMSAGIGALAQHISREMLSIMDVQDYPLSRIIQDLSVIEQGHVDLPFDIVSTIEINPDLYEIDEVDFGGGKFPLMATLAKFGAGTFLSIEHFTSLYSESWAERFAHSLLSLITSLAENPDKPLSTVDILPAGERNRLINEFNDTASDYPRDAGLGSLLAKQITDDSRADKTAIDDGKTRVTYAELGILLSDISGKLDQLGVKAGDTVAFASERNLDAILTMLGIVWHGAVYLPIDKSLPANAIAELMEECGATTLLFDAAEKDRLAKLSERFKVAALPKGDLKSGAEFKAPTERGGGDLAYVMFTSGSTGKPKGVLVPNRGIVRLVVNNKTLPFDEHDVIAQAASLGFDAATLEIWAALLNGGRLFVLENDALFDLSALGDKLRFAGVTTMWMTASLFNLIADVAPEAFKPLKRLMSGGEALSPVHLRKIRAACPDVTLINGYGPTENTTFTCTHLITEHDLQTGLIPIGRPIGNTRIYVLDDAGHLVPTDVWGELYAAGDGLALGYTGAPERTEKAFVQIPGIDEERLYKTGDRVRWRADGTIEFGGRGDGQVKIRGHRIELNAIEEKLLALDDIRNVCVMPIGHGADAFLGAAIASDHDARDNWASVLARDFPDYMVPERFVVLEHLPVNANGKVDRKKLQAIIAEEEQVIAASPESDNTLEAFVIKQFESLFPNKTITAATDFFALGGHSLIAMRLAGMIEEETGYRPKLQEIFAARTPANMALLAAKHQTQPKQTVLASKTETKFALSSGQARLWVLQRMEPELAVYSVPVTLDIAGPVDAAALQRALHKLEERQHALRLRFKSDPDHPDGVSQYLAPVGSLELVHYHMDAATADTFIATETVRPFDLNDASMVRAQLITVAEHRHCLMITLHHAICDGWSMPILLSELAELYQAELAGTAAKLPKIERHYEDFVAWQRDYLRGEDGKAALDRWKERLAQLPEPLNLPTDFPRPAERKFAGDFYEFELGAATTRLIEQTAQKFGVTAFNTLTALLQVLLYRHCGQSDVAMGMLVAGREHSSLDRLVGFFVNTVLIRQKLDPDARFESHLAQTQKVVLDAVADHAIPFEDVVNAVKAPRDLSRNPLFDVLVAWQDNLPTGAKLGDADATVREIEFPFAKFDLGFYFWRDENALCGSVEFDTGLFERPTIASLIERLETLCQSALEDSIDAPLSELSILPERERAQIAAFNATQKDLPIDRCISEPFLDQVAEIPDRVAVQDDVEALSYHQFARRAAGIAELLKDKSIKPGDVVGVAIRRSVNMLAAIHGILLSGAAYSPLDPDHPEQRRKDMLDDLGEGWVITTSDLADLFDKDRTILIDGSEDADIPALSSGPDDLAYVLFTSGSTGRPKGVEIAHRGVLNRILWMQDEFPLGTDDVILQKTPITFDVSVWELFWWSWTGSKVVLPAPGAERDPAQIAGAIHDNRVTTMHFVPSMLSAFLTAVESGTVDVNKLASLRRVFASGEALDAAVVRRFNTLLFDRFGTELHNLYGPTEATVDVTWQACSPQTTGDVVPIGKPIANTTVQILTNDFKPLPIGVVGEIILGGPQIALGYRNRAELSAEKFPADPSDRGDRLYRTGDLGRWRRDGAVEYLGRIDHQVKIRGYRIEIGEVEVALESHPNVERAPVVVASVAGLNELHAFILPSGNIDAISLRDHLRSRLPEYMIPARFFAIDHLPMTSSGKVDRKALKGTPIRARSTNAGATAPSTASVAAARTDNSKSREAEVAKLWAEILPDVTPTRDDGFFDIGGNSLLLLRLFEKFEANWPGRVGIADLFANPTIAKQAELISDEATSPTNLGSFASDAPILANDEPIAVIGMAVQVAGADTIDGFWDDIAAGRDLVRALPEAREADTREILNAIGRPVPTKFREIAYLDHLFEFDAQRFRLSPIDAGLLDPEQRLFIETTLMAVEDSGYGGNALRGQKVGVFAGGGTNPIWRMAMDQISPSKAEQAFALNVPSNIVTRLSFLKDWHGPANIVDTACSSTLVAVHQACQQLRDGSCTVAIAGGAKILPCPPDADSAFTIDSSTARTRAFDANADGTGMGEGSVVFVLKPLSNAMQDGDTIHAIIRGSAVNQDGASSGAAAPNPLMQAEVIRDAARAADVELSTVSYFEAHGTGTSLGDPIEIDGLTRAFKDREPAKTRAFIGSGKGNYGHLDGTAGALGLARAIMVLRHDQAPPQPYFEAPNPKINFDRAPVVVTNNLAKLPDQGTPRRAGVSSFGLSGINAHILIEAAPERSKQHEADQNKEAAFVFALSAGSQEALRTYATNLHHRISNDATLSLKDIAFTLATGRDRLKHGIAFAADHRADLLEQLLDIATGITTPSMQAENADAPVCDVATAKTADADKQAALYLAGGALNWPSNIKARRVSLPPAPFTRKSFKPTFEKRAKAVSNDLLQGPVSTPSARVFSIAMDDPGFWPLNDHKLNGHPTLVGMSVPALIAKAVTKLRADETAPINISNLVWHTALVANAIPDGNVSLSFADDGTVELGGRLKNGKWRVFATAIWQSAPQATAPKSGLADIRTRAKLQVPVNDFSGKYGSIAISDRWDCNQSLHVSNRQDAAIKHLRLKPEYRGDLTDWLVHPALADVACSMPLMTLDSGYVPVGVDQVTVYGVPSSEVYACFEQHENGYGEVALYDAKTEQLVMLASGLNFAKSGEGAGQLRPQLLETVWRVSPASAANMSENCLFITDADNSSCPTGYPTIQVDQITKDCLSSISHAVLMLRPDENSAYRTANALRTILQNMQGRIRLIVVGCGAYGIADDLVAINPDQSAAAGVVLAAAREEPQLQLSYLDIPADALVDQLGSELATLPATDPIVVYRNGQRYVRDLTLAKADTKTEKTAWPSSGVCVVTGGTGGFSVALLEEFANNGSVKLALLGRRGEDALDDPTKAKLTDLRKHGLSISVHACNVADAASLGKALEAIRINLGPIRAVVHAAGIADGDFLVRRDMAKFDDILAAKMMGARHLDHLTRDDAIAAFVMFGSLTAISGAPGQTGYCAANAFLDGLAHQRQADGKPALTIDWCALSEQGMAARHNVRLEDGAWISPKDAKTIWRDAIRLTTAQLTVVDPSLVQTRHTAQEATTQRAAKTALPSVTLSARQQIAAIWAEALGYDSVNADDDFFALGGDSITGMQIVDRMNSTLGTELSISDLFSAPTTAAIAELAGLPETYVPTAQPAPVMEPALANAQGDKAPHAVISAIWADALGYDAIDPDEDFFALGGDSITGMQIVDRIAKELDLDVSLTDLFEQSTISKLATKLLGTADATSPAISTGMNEAPAVFTPATDVSVEPAKIDPRKAPKLDRYPLSPEQLSVLNASQKGNMGTAFNLSHAFALEPSVDLNRLKDAIREVTKRENILRTRIIHNASEENWHMEIIAPEDAVASLDLDVRRVEGSLGDACVAQMRPFDLDDGIPVRWALLQDQFGNAALFFDIHHVLADGFTTERILGETAYVYSGKALPPLGYQLNDYAWWSQNEENTKRIAAARDYWQSIYAGSLPKLDLPSDRPRPAYHSFNGAITSLVIDQDLLTKARKFASAHRVTMYTLVMATWFTLLGRLAKTNDVVISVPVDARDATGFRDTLGMMVSLLPLRMQFDGTENVADLLARMQRHHIDAMRHRAYFLDQLLHDLAPPAAPDRTLLSEVSVSYMNYESTGIGPDIAKIASESIEVHRHHCKNDISIFVRDVPEQLTVSLDYYADMFDRSSMNELCRAFAATLEHMVTSETRLIRDIDIVSGSPLSKLRHWHNEPETQVGITSSPAISTVNGSETVNVIAEIFSEVFKKQITDPATSFVTLGGHSLLAIRIVNRIADRTGSRISMADFFANPTVAGLAGLIDGNQSGETNKQDARIPTAPDMAVYPASHAQKRLYLLSEMAHDSGAYGMLYVLRCDGTLKQDALRAALTSLVNRHEPLRTAFEQGDDGICQRIATSTAPDVTVHNITAQPDPVREALRLTREEAAKPIILGQPPLIRASIINVADDEQLLVIATHHIVGDGWSSRILVQELGIFYQAALNSRAADLPDLPITYKDFAYWQSQQDWSDTADYWREKLSGAPDQIALPFDHKLPDVQSYRGAHAHMAIDDDVLAGLHALAHAHNATLSAVGMALFSAMLYRLTRQEDLVIGMGVAGREKTETEGLIGFFVNVLPIRVQLDAETDLDTLIDHIHVNLTEALDRQDYPFDELVRAVAPKRNTNRQPLVNVVFEYQRFGALGGEETTQPGLPMLTSDQPGMLSDKMDAFIDNATAKHDVILFLQEEDGKARFTLEYDTDLFDAETMQKWLGFLTRFAAAAAQNHTNKNA